MWKNKPVSVKYYKDAHERKLVPFFCLTVYRPNSYRWQQCASCEFDAGSLVLFRALSEWHRHNKSLLFSPDLTLFTLSTSKFLRKSSYFKTWRIILCLAAGGARPPVCCLGVWSSEIPPPHLTFYLSTDLKPTSATITFDCRVFPDRLGEIIARMLSNVRAHRCCMKQRSSRSVYQFGAVLSTVVVNCRLIIVKLFVNNICELTLYVHCIALSMRTTVGLYLRKFGVTNEPVSDPEGGWAGAATGIQKFFAR